MKSQHLFLITFLFLIGCETKNSTDESVNIDNLESEIVTQTLPILVERIPKQPYAIDLEGDEELSEFYKREKIYQTKFKTQLDSLELQIHLSDKLWIPTESEISKYRRILDWDFFKYLSNDTLVTKGVDISNIDRIDKVIIVKDSPKNIGTETELGFLGFAYFSRIQFNEDHSKAKFIFSFNGGSGEFKEYIVQVVKTKNKWHINSIKEIKTFYISK